MAEGRQNQKPKQRRNDSYAIKPSKETGNNGRLSRKEKFTKTRAATNWKKIIQLISRIKFNQKSVQKCKLIAAKSPDE